MKRSSSLYKVLIVAGILASTLYACKETSPAIVDSYPAIKAAFGAAIDPLNLPNYAAQTKPAYITKENTTSNPITNEGATLGRVLFYDVNLSIDNTVSCSQCHRQEFAFGDTALASSGVNGITGRHSMRLINSRFAVEKRFFWDKRAINLEDQTRQPIKDHKEMGFSGTNGDPSFNDLIAKLEGIDYYTELFTMAYGDKSITELRVQNALAQFVRSIQSFDSKYDAGRAMVTNDPVPFPNFTAQENQGKQLYLQAPQFNGGGLRIGGGAGCQGCHRAPEFDIDPGSMNNGVVGVIGDVVTDLTNTRSPSLRDFARADGTLITDAMHDGSLKTLDGVIEHYNTIVLVPGNTNMDLRLTPAGLPQKLQLTAEEKAALAAFIKTLSGTAVYADARWSDPF